MPPKAPEHDHKNDKFCTPAWYGIRLANSWDPDDLPIPSGSWIEWKDDSKPKSQTCLQLDLRSAIHHKKIFGYVGHIRKLKLSQNTDSPFLLTIVTKVVWPEDDSKDFTDLSKTKVAFARVGAFSANWADSYRTNDDSNFCLGDFIQGVVEAPSSDSYRYANLTCWRKASLSEWERFYPNTQFRPGQVQLDADSVFRLPILGGRHFPRYTDSNNVVVCTVRQPRLPKSILEDRSRVKGRLSRLDDDALTEIDAAEHDELGTIPENVEFESFIDDDSRCAYSRASFVENSPNAIIYR